MFIAQLNYTLRVQWFRDSDEVNETQNYLFTEWTIVYISQYLTEAYFKFSYTLIDGLVQKCSISIAIALEILQSCTKPLTYFTSYTDGNTDKEMMVLKMTDADGHPVGMIK